MSISSTETSAKPALGLAEFVSLMALMTSLVALSIDAMLPAMTQISHDLQVTDSHQVHLIVSLFFAGMAFGQLFFGPYADARGRRETILLGLIIFGIGTLVCMSAESLTMLLVGRLIQAFGVSGPRIAAMAVIRDQYAGSAMARVMSFIMMVFILVPMLAPMVGQWVLEWFHWRHIFTLFLVVATGSGVWFFMRQPETLPKAQRRKFNWGEFVRSSKFILTHRAVMGYTLAMGFVFGSFLAYISASQTIFVGFYDMGDMFPYIFATLAFSIGLASFFNGTMVMKMGMHRLVSIAMHGSILFALVYTALIAFFGGLPPIWLTISVMFIGFFFVGILFGNLNAMAMHPLGKMAGLGAAIISSLSSVFSVPIALFIDQFLTDNLMPIGLGFVVFFSLAHVAIRWANTMPVVSADTKD